MKKRFGILFVGLAVIAIVLLLLLGRRAQSPSQNQSKVLTSEKRADHQSTQDPTIPNGSLNEPASDLALSSVQQSTKATQEFNEAHHVPMVFCGQVVDQNGNPLAGVRIGANVRETHMEPRTSDHDFEFSQTNTNLEKETGADGRFEVTGLTGDSLCINSMTKEGYEPEISPKLYGIYGPKSTGFENPAVFKMWSTNLHEPLIVAEKSFVIIPDGRRYAIDLVKGAMAEGDNGDVVAWIRRPEKIDRGQRYGWSCELALPGGGLLESDTQVMFTAPDTGYTNLFAYHEEASVSGWGGGFERKRFYIRLRNGQYGRISVDLYADYHGKEPALIRLSYAVNPSGSRLLR